MIRHSLNGGEIQTVLQGLIEELQKYLRGQICPKKGEQFLSINFFANDPVFDTEKCNFLRTHFREKFWEAKRLRTQLGTQRTKKILPNYPLFRDIVNQSLDDM